MLDLETEVVTGPGSILTEGNILLLFLRSKACDANIGIIAIVVCLQKNRLFTEETPTT